ncbi:MAG: diacylglycerol kinase family protein [Planctomycetales bacterium]
MNQPAAPSSCPAPELVRDRRKRPAWRQRLVDAERGMTLGLRSDSTFFVHFFAIAVVVAGGTVLGLSLVEWVLIVLAITLVLAAEMFKQVLNAVLRSVGHHFAREAAQSLRIATAAVFVTIGGALLAVTLVFANAVRRMVE